MWSTNICNKMSNQQSSVVDQKGFIHIYALILLNMLLLFSGFIIQKVKSNTIKDDQTLSMAEIYAIQKAKTDLENYDESEETVSFLNYTITFNYEDVTCEIDIGKEGETVLKSSLIYDDIELQVQNYFYRE